MLCLLVQKDTFQNNKLKSIIKIIEIEPEELLSQLHEEHCIEFQLIAYTKTSENLVEKIKTISLPHKTKYGKDWFEFEPKTLSEIISVFLKSSKTIIDLDSISNIVDFSLQLFPIVTKEIYTQSIIERLEIIDKEDDKDKEDNKDKNKEEDKEEVSEIVQIIKEYTKLPRDKKKDKKDKKVKN